MRKSTTPTPSAVIQRLVGIDPAATRDFLIKECYYYTTDRGRTWEGPCTLPNFGQQGIAARTDYLIDGPREMTMFLTAAKSDGREGRVICVRTKDGAKTWEFVGFVHPEPEGNEFGIMPSSVRLSPTSIVTAVRARRWIDLYRSDDNGQT